MPLRASHATTRIKKHTMSASSRLQGDLAATYCCCVAFLTSNPLLPWNRFLHGPAVKAAAAAVDEALRQGPRTGVEGHRIARRLLKDNGVNMRHLGRVRQQVATLAAQRTLLELLAARAIKCRARREMRMYTHQSALQLSLAISHDSYLRAGEGAAVGAMSRDDTFISTCVQCANRYLAVAATGAPDNRTNSLLQLITAYVAFSPPRVVHHLTPSHVCFACTRPANLDASPCCHPRQNCCASRPRGVPFHSTWQRIVS